MVPDLMYTISKKSVTKQRTELGIRNSKKSLLPPELRTPKSEPRIMMD
jgi:hypothetical protein